MISYIIQAVTYVITWLLSSFHALSVSMIALVFSRLSAALPAYDFSPWLLLFDQIDYFFPLSETMLLGLAWFGIYVGCFVYRTGKSWIPFVSGS